MKNSTFVGLVMLCGLLLSCTRWGSNDNSHLMQQVQIFMEQMPDSALTLLDAMNTEGFSRAENAEYSLLLIQAKSNAGMDISSDTEIFDVKEYFIHRKDSQKAAWACYFAALVADEQKQTTLAMEYCQEALDFAGNTDNKELQGRILHNMGYLNYNNEWYDDALICYQQALKIFNALGLYQREVSTLYSISNSLFLNHQFDSAQYYYRQTLNQAFLHDDTTFMLQVYNSMGAAYRKQGQYDLATDYIRQALRLATNDDEKIYIYTNFAYLFHETDRVDSARYYVQLADTLLNKIDNIYTTASYAFVLSNRTKGRKLSASAGIF